ncbi:hypothetical protein NBRC116586_27340 [Pseudooceanicola nitratireducens]
MFVGGALTFTRTKLVLLQVSVVWSLSISRVDRRKVMRCGFGCALVCLLRRKTILFEPVFIRQNTPVVLLPGRERSGVEAVSCTMREHTLGSRGCLVASRRAIVALWCQVPLLKALRLIEIAHR